MKRLFRYLGPVIVLLVFLAAVWLVYNELRHCRLADIGAKILQMSPLGLGLALVLTIINYAILVGYDMLAIRFIGEKVTLRRIALASFTGYAASYNFGATLAGTTIRFRLYSAWGLSPLKILELLIILGLTFWFGLFALAGVIFIIDPPQLVGPRAAHQAQADPGRKHAAHAQRPADGKPATDAQEKAGGNNWGNNWGGENSTAQNADEARRAKLKETLGWIVHLAANMRFWGVVLLLLALAYLGISAASLTHIRIFGKELPVPPFKLTLYQFGIVAADMLVAGLVIYSLMHDIPGVPGYAGLLGIYMLVYVAVVLSHVPGGYGVFEAGMLFCLRQASPVPIPADSVMAAIFVFRIIYFWLPLLLAIVLLGINEVILRRRGQGDETPQAAGA